jgi:hypothetical protein
MPQPTVIPPQLLEQADAVAYALFPFARPGQPNPYCLRLLVVFSDLRQVVVETDYVTGPQAYSSVGIFDCDGHELAVFGTEHAPRRRRPLPAGREHTILAAAAAAMRLGTDGWTAPIALPPEPLDAAPEPLDAVLALLSDRWHLSVRVLQASLKHLAACYIRAATSLEERERREQQQEADHDQLIQQAQAWVRAGAPGWDAAVTRSGADATMQEHERDRPSRLLAQIEEMHLRIRLLDDLQRGIRVWNTPDDPLSADQWLLT